MRYIADANVLLPVLTEGHAHRAPALEWWERCEGGEVGLCLPVRMALLRLLTNVRVMGSGTLQPEQAWGVLDQLLNDPRICWIDATPSAHDSHWQSNIAGREPSPDLWTDASGLLRWPRRATATWSRSIGVSAPSLSSSCACSRPCLEREMRDL